MPEVAKAAIYAAQDLIEYFGGERPATLKKEKDEPGPTPRAHPRQNSAPAGRAAASPAKKPVKAERPDKKKGGQKSAPVIESTKKHNWAEIPPRPKIHEPDYRSKSEISQPKRPRSKRESKVALSEVQDEMAARKAWRQSQRAEAKALEKSKSKKESSSQKVLKTGGGEKKSRVKDAVVTKQKAKATKGKAITKESAKDTDAEAEVKEAVPEEISELNRGIGNNERTLLEGMQRLSVVAAWNDGKSRPVSGAGSKKKDFPILEDLTLPEHNTEMGRLIGDNTRTILEGMQLRSVAQQWFVEEEAAKDPLLPLVPRSKMDRQIGDNTRTILEGMAEPKAVKQFRKDSKKKK